MVAVTLLFAGLGAYAIGLVYVIVGVRLIARHLPSGASQRALRYFALWWFALAANLALGGSIYVAAAFGWTNFDVQLTYLHVQRLLLAVSLLGLMYYLLFLVTGREMLWLVTVFYGFVWLFFEWSLAAGMPDRVEVFRWRTDLHMTVDTGPIALIASGALILLPPVVGAIVTFFRVFPRVATRTQRYRIAIVCWSLVVWWIVAVIAGQRATLDADGYQTLNRLVDLSAAGLILAAYVPPRWVRVRYGVEALGAATA